MAPENLITTALSGSRPQDLRLCRRMFYHISVQNIRVLKDDSGEPLDATEVVLRYLQSLPNAVVDPELNRIQLLASLPSACFGNAEIQPLRGCKR